MELKEKRAGVKKAVNVSKPGKQPGIVNPWPAIHSSIYLFTGGVNRWINWML